MRRLLLRADYHCNPLWWDDSHPDVANFGAHINDMSELGISPQLVVKLLDWAKAFDSSLNWDDPGSGSPWSAEQWLLFLEDGEVLLGELQNEIGDRFLIRYFHGGQLIDAR